MVADLRHTLAVEHPGLAIAGSAYEGVGLPACIHDGRLAARRLLDTRG